MYPLLFASILVVTLAIERLYFWFKIGRRQQKLIRTVLDLYQQHSTLAIRLSNEFWRHVGGRCVAQMAIVLLRPT